MENQNSYRQLCGVKLLHDPLRNKGTAFTQAERTALGLRGLLPPRVCSPEEQELRVLGNIHSKATDLERYQFLVGLQDRNETLFYRVVMNNIEEMLPLIYTPTVGAACTHFHHIFRRSRGLYISLEDRGSVEEILNNWPHDETRIIVVTDGERILGLGDLGAAGMGIPVGKLALYSACAGIHPSQCLPITLDVGTNNEAMLQDRLYLGLNRRRERGIAYQALVEELLYSAKKRFPGVLIQLEDFGNANAFKLLNYYRDHICIFDDDIQGTGAVGLAGLLAALHIKGGCLVEQKILFVGAGQAGLGMGSTIVAAMKQEGVPDAHARACCWYMDSQGLLTQNRSNIPQQKLYFAHSHEPLDNLLTVVKTLKPTVIVGCSGQGGLFTEAILKAMADINERPIIFSLSNPTAKSECTAEQAYQATQGRCIFASGSPFPTVQWRDRIFVPGQCNNAYIFPGVGLGVVVSQAKQVTDDMFLAAARALAAQVSEIDLAQGRIFPSLTRIREVSLAIAVEVARIAYQNHLTDREEPEDITADIRSYMFIPEYPVYA